MVRKSNRHKSSLKEHSYVAVLAILVVFLFAFAFLSPIGLGGDITGFQVLSLTESSPQVAALSFIVLVFGVLFLLVFTYNLMSRVM